MATLYTTPCPLASSSWTLKKNPSPTPFLSKRPFFGQQTHLLFSLSSSAPNSKTSLKFLAKAEQENDPSSSSSSKVENPEKEDTQKGNLFLEVLKDAGFKLASVWQAAAARYSEENESMLDQELDKFLSNPSVEAMFELLSKVPTPLTWMAFSSTSLPVGKARDALDLDKLRSCFVFDTFLLTDATRFGNGGIFIGYMIKPVEAVIPALEKKLSEAAGREVVLWLTEEEVFLLGTEEGGSDITMQVCVVQPKAELDLQFESTMLSTPLGYVRAVVLCLATFGTIAWMSGFFLKPDATFGDYLNAAIPVFGGFLSILGISEMATRVTAARYGVKLSPSFLLPSNWTGCFGVMNNYESLLPNRKARFDIPVARTASAYLTSLVLAIVAYVAHGSFNGGDNALYVRPEFFHNNSLLSFIQLVIGPYVDDLGNVLPSAVEGVGVPVDPLAFAGLLGIAMTSLNLLPFPQFEGGRIARAMFGEEVVIYLFFATLLLMVIGALNGSNLCLAWGLFALLFRSNQEVPAKDEISPLGYDRAAWGFVLGVICYLTLFPNGGGTFSSSFSGSTIFNS